MPLWMVPNKKVSVADVDAHYPVLYALATVLAPQVCPAAVGSSTFSTTPK